MNPLYPLQQGGMRLAQAGLGPIPDRPLGGWPIEIILFSTLVLVVVAATIWYRSDPLDRKPQDPDEERNRDRDHE